MFTTCTPPDLTPFVRIDNVKDDLVSHDIDKPLSANQGRILNDNMIGISPTISGQVLGTSLRLTNREGEFFDVDVSALGIDTHSMSGAYDAATQSIVISLNDTTSFTIPVASLLPVLTTGAISGNGSSLPIKIDLSADITNNLSLDINGHLHAPKYVLTLDNSTLTEIAGVSKVRISNDITNILTVDTEGLLVPRPEGLSTTIHTTGVMTGDGSPELPVDLVLNPISSNLLEQTPEGLLVPTPIRYGLIKTHTLTDTIYRVIPRHAKIDGAVWLVSKELGTILDLGFTIPMFTNEEPIIVTMLYSVDGITFTTYGDVIVSIEMYKLFNWNILLDMPLILTSSLVVVKLNYEIAFGQGDTLEINRINDTLNPTGSTLLIKEIRNV